MMSTVESSLLSFIQTHRIVFWYNAQKELRAEYDALPLPNVTKLELANNEFAAGYGSFCLPGRGSLGRETGTNLWRNNF